MSEFAAAVKVLRRNPGFVATVTMTLALGIGAATATFSVVNKVLLEPLPYPQPERLVQLIGASRLGAQPIASIPKFLIWREHTTTLENVAAAGISATAVALSDGNTAEPVAAARVSSTYFQLLGATFTLGRTFTKEEDEIRGVSAVILSDRMWRRRFNADASILGKGITLDRRQYKVAGVVAPGFVSRPAAEIWFPLQVDPSSSDHVGSLFVMGRMRPGVTVEQARQDVGHTMDAFLGKYRPDPAADAPLIPLEDFSVIPLRDAVAGNVRPAFFLLGGAVSFVLLISCANAAGLLVARANRRASEFALRAAIGAQRIQLIYQLLAESTLLGLCGGVAGLAFGMAGVRALLESSPADLPRIGANGAAISFDWRVFLFALCISMMTGVLFGLLPAMTASRADVISLTKDTVAESGMGLRRNRTRPLLVIVQMALAIVLLVGAGLLIRTFVAQRTISRGFDESNVFTLEMSLSNANFERTADVAGFISRAEWRIGRFGGVDSIATTSALPLQPAAPMPFSIVRLFQERKYDGTISWRSVSKDYFRVFQIRLMRGRFFTDGDTGAAAGVVLINRAMMMKYWTEVDANPIGDFVLIGKGLGPGFEEPPRQIIGVVADVREAGLDREPSVYVPAAQVSDGMNARTNRLTPVTWAVRTATANQAVLADIQQELEALSGGQAMGPVRTMHQVIAASSARARFYMMVFVVIASLALVLAAGGLYGVMAYSVQQRAREIGIRMALGAAPADVRGMVVRQGLTLVSIGMGLGIPIALGLTKITISVVFGIQMWDPTVLVLVATALAIVAVCATYLPSRTATRIHPADSLKGRS